MMNRSSIGMHSLLIVMIGLVPVLFPAAGETGVRLTTTPFVDYACLTKTDGASPVLHRINAIADGWLGDYREFELFNHLFLVGVEVRIGFPALPRGLDLFLSVSGSSGSVGMLGKDYDRSADINALPDIPELQALPFPPSLLTVDGRVRTRIDQFLEYAVPVQAGIRYETNRIGDMPVAFFGSVGGGPIFVKGGLDIDIDIDGAVSMAMLSESFYGNFAGKASLQDIGWISSLMIGVRYDWRQGLSSSVAAGFGSGRVRNKARVRGHFTGGSPNLGDVAMETGFREPLTIRLDSFRLRWDLLTRAW